MPQISKFQSFLRQFLSSGFGMLWTFQSYCVLWDGRPSRLVSPWASPRVRQSERELRASGLCWHPTESLGILKLEYITYIQHHTIYIYMYHFARLESKRLWVRLHIFMHLHTLALPFKKINPLGVNHLAASEGKDWHPAVHTVILFNAPQLLWMQCIVSGASENFRDETWGDRLVST